MMSQQSYSPKIQNNYHGPMDSRPLPPPPGSAPDGPTVLPPITSILPPPSGPFRPPEPSYTNHRPPEAPFTTPHHGTHMDERFDGRHSYSPGGPPSYSHQDRNSPFTFSAGPAPPFQGPPPTSHPAHYSPHQHEMRPPVLGKRTEKYGPTVERALNISTVTFDIEKVFTVPPINQVLLLKFFYR